MVRSARMNAETTMIASPRSVGAPSPIWWTKSRTMPVGDEHAGELPECEPVARDQEVGEDHRVDGVKVQEDRGVRRARERGADVHGADLESEEEPEKDERPPLGTFHAEACEPSGRPRPEPDDDAPDEEAHPGQPDGRGV